MLKLWGKAVVAEDNVMELRMHMTDLTIKGKLSAG
jgi:hypothetical protein